MSKETKQIEYGDFQTPKGLADQVCKVIKRDFLVPKTIIEPTCGVGNFVAATIDAFPADTKLLSFDIEPSYVEQVKKIVSASRRRDARVEVADFFEKDWDVELEKIKEPILIIGNPPWVTNSQLGVIKGKNLPVKGNFQNLKGFEAVTGKSNFDISEWMILQMIDWLGLKNGVLAMLCKTSVARRVLRYAWENNSEIGEAKIYLIDAPSYFQIATDACLLVISSIGDKQKKCKVYENLSTKSHSQEMGFRDNYLIANIPNYEETKHLYDGKQYYKWRTGVKHDSSKVMELTPLGGNLYRNGFGKKYELEDEYLYPLLKGSDLANGKEPKKVVIITQTRVGEDTSVISKNAPKTWRYLVEHSSFLDKRASSIYRNKPQFSIFGIGDYTFSLWKVAIPALYKKLDFSLISSHKGKPIIFDDTVNFISAQNKKEAERLVFLLNSEKAQKFYNALIFFDSKRPVTVQLLKSLDINKLADDVGIRSLPRKSESATLSK